MHIESIFLTWKENMKKTSAVLTRARRKVLILGRRRRCRLEGRQSRRVVPAAQFVSHATMSGGGWCLQDSMLVY